MKRLEIWLLSCLLLAPIAARAAKPAELNTITRVEVKGNAVEIGGSKKPNFSTFTMTDPPRLVIDISEAVFSGVPEETKVGNGIVTSIKTASYGANASAIARVLIGFSREVETDLAASGTKLVVKILHTSGPEVAVNERAAAPTLSSGDDADRKAEQDRLEEQKRQAEELSRKAIAVKALQAEQERLEEQKRQAETSQRQAEELARAEKERLANEQRLAGEAERRANEQRLAEEAERRAATERALKAAEQRMQEERRQAGQGKEEQARSDAARQAAERKAAEEERQRNLEEEREVRRQAAAEKARKVEEERLAKQKAREDAKEARRQAAADKARQAQEKRLAKRKAREEARRLAAAEKARQAEEEKAATRQARDEAMEAERQAAAERTRVAEQARISKQQQPGQESEPENPAEEPNQGRVAARSPGGEKEVQPQAPVEKAKRASNLKIISGQRERRATEGEGGEASPQVSSRRKTMTFIGFEQRPSASRVYVRTNEPVHYSVQQNGEKMVVLELENTRIALRNNRRPLDTSFFDSAVAMVAPNIASSRHVLVQIKLKEAVAYQAKQEGNVVSVEFSHPAKH